MRRVAVCIPVFNGGRTIARTIENLLLQTYKDFEIIVYDDGSTDFTANIVARLANGDSRIRLVRGGVNRGRGFARNALLELTSGRLIAWQDADDSWAPDKLEQQIRFFDGINAEDDNTIVLSTYELTKLDMDPPESVLKSPPPDFDLAHMMTDSYRDCHFQLQATLGPADAFRRAGGFDPDLNWAEDLDMALGLLRAGSRIKGHATERPLCTYFHSIRRARPGMVSECQQIVRDRFRAFAAEHGYDLDRVMALRSASYLGRMYASKGQYPRALATNLTALLHLHPDEEEQIQRIAANLAGLIRSMSQAK